MKRITSLVIAMSALVIFFAGCSKGIKFPRVYSVKVTVLNDGEKMPDMLVTFYPTKSIGNFSVQGETDSSGTCKIVTIATGKKKIGAPQGDYAVTVERHLPQANDAESVRAVQERAAKENWSQSEYMDAMVNLNNERDKKNEELAAVVPGPLRFHEETPIRFTVSGKGDLTIRLDEYK